MEYTFELMEELLRIEAEVKGFLATDRAYERELRQELSTILEEAEFLFGARDRSYELLEPRITECGYACPYIFYPFKKIRIYLTSNSKLARYFASFELSHEAIHVLSPTRTESTVLEEGLASYFSIKYVNRVYRHTLDSTYHPVYDAAMHAVSPLLAKNKFVIKELRARQPLISKIDEKLLVEVTGIEPERARFLCTDFRSYWERDLSWRKRAEQDARLFVNCVRSIWER